MNIGQIRVINGVSLQCVGWMADIHGYPKKFDSEQKAKNTIKHMIKNFDHEDVEPYPIFKIVDEE